MKAKITEVCVWSTIEDGGTAYFKTRYNTGTVKMYKRSYFSHPPKSVDDFVENAPVTKKRIGVTNYYAE